MKRLAGILVGAVLCALLVPVPVRPQSPPGEAKTPPVYRETGEAEGDAFHLPPIPVDPRVYQLDDPAITDLARKIEDGSANMIQRRAWWWLEQRLAPFDRLPPGDWRLKAQATLKALERPRAEQAGPEPRTTYTWAPIGPQTFPDYYYDNVSGRATALWVDPSDANTILLGTADGGVWKTTTGGTTWTSLFDTAASLSIGCIGVDPNNKQVIYVGTGEGNFCIDAIGGAGIYKSTNGGSTWAQLSGTGTSNTSFRRIVVDPLDSQKVYAAGYNLYYSTNGGTSWNTTTCGASSGNYHFTDVVLDSVNGTGSTSIVYAAIGYYYSMASNGVYRSTTGGGGTWTKISSSTGFPTTNVGRITLLPAPSDPKQMYVLIQSTSTYQSLGIYYTADAHAATVTWSLKNNTTQYCSSQCWYDMTGVVHPTDPTKLIVGGLDVYASTNSGTTLTQVSQWWNTGSVFSHADHHHMVIIPLSATTLYNANDGGFFIATITWATPSMTWVNKNAGLGTLQFYGMAQHPTDPTKVQGGLQDNGQFYYDGTSWLEVEGGDGGASAWDQSNALYAYEEYVYAGIARNSNMVGTPSTWTCIQNINGCANCDGSCTPDGRCAFIAPFTLDANNQNTMYTGTYRIWQNSAPRTGSTWSAISTDLTGGSGYVTAIHSARNNGTTGTIYAGTSSGYARVTTNGGTNWTDISPITSSRPSITSFTTDPTNGQRVLITYSGYGANHIYRSTNGGGAWTNITGSLPAVPFNTIILDPADSNHAYAGSDFGVYENTAVWTGTTWTSISYNLPAVSVQQLVYLSGSKLRAATHGRGIWEFTISSVTPKEASPARNMTAAKGSGTTVNVTYTAGCGATDHTVYAGSLATLQSSGISWSSRFCNKGTTGSLSFDTGSSNAYFVVVANDGTQEGSYGQSSTPAERPAAGAGSPCSYTQNLAGTCP
jgi:hypothetical protein